MADQSEEQEREVEPTHPHRGIVATKIPRVALYSFTLKVRLSELPMWKPRVSGDRGRREGEG